MGLGVTENLVEKGILGTWDQVNLPNFYFQENLL